MKKTTNMDRRYFLKRLGITAGGAVAAMALKPLKVWAGDTKSEVTPADDNRMTYRVQHGSGERISLLGFGMMRLPDGQEQVDELVDYAIAHGVNYFDTAAVYHNGMSEVVIGKVLKNFPRDSFYLATKFPGHAISEKYDPAEMKTLETRLDDMRAALDGGGDSVDAFFRADNAFHDQISKMGKNPLADKIGRVVRTLTHAMRYETVSAMIRGGRGQELMAAHEKLRDALKRRDLSQLEKIVRDSYFGEALQSEQES